MRGNNNKIKNVLSYLKTESMVDYEKNIRKVLSTTAALAMCCGTLLSVSANELEPHEPPQIEERYIVSCPGGGKHIMIGRAEGRIHYGTNGNSTWVLTGTASQCTICNLVLVTENNPFMVNTTHPWGRYALKSEEKPISGKVIYIYNRYSLF